ncbi:MAG: hypothetical protein COB17_09675 [Sulfurimonas sp.]|nr:MAG: hypothetical protein COB17_09675 [Sulfurimonas sp.]
MTFFSGFSLKNEQYLFEDFINTSDYCVCGFSYGSMKAFKHVKDLLQAGKRVDTLQMLSPVFFQTKSTRFKRVQIMAHKTNNKAYMEQFLDSCFNPYAHKLLEFEKNTTNDLEELLNHKWISQDFLDIAKQGVKIEVYLGGLDKIIDVQSAREFFTQVSTLTFIKDSNHFLQVN